MEEAKKTPIVYKANLNFKRVDAYLPYLVDKGLIENTGAVYKTTEKGKEFLHVLQEDEGAAYVTLFPILLSLSPSPFPYPSAVSHLAEFAGAHPEGEKWHGRGIWLWFRQLALV
ncbi:MAG: winged helix-turn-helix domain-containing protein, partial [Proteobacteria bacterium]|nr:winged helix-turn-helix domain-containing protein [Pseudomonadota bacterium]